MRACRRPRSGRNWRSTPGTPKATRILSTTAVFSFIEALLLSVVAVLAAYAGYSSAKWSTESRLDLAAASSAHTAASRANLESITTRNFDASTFNTWFAAYVAKSPAAMDVAVRRFRPEFKVAFDAWIATDPTTNPHAPSGPTYMSEYKELTA